MNLDDDRELEWMIDRELKALKPMAAPQTLVGRVVGAIGRAEELPRPGWEAWPGPARAALLAVLLAAFLAMCRASQPWVLAPALPGLRQCAALLETSGKMTDTLSQAGQVVIGHVGTNLIAAGIAVLLLAYGACLGLGTIYVRLAMNRR